MRTPYRLTVFLLALTFGGTAWLWSQATRLKPAAPVLGESLRYCNPLPIETTSKDGSPQGVSLGDVTIVPEGGQYYMFCTGGGGWVSKDLVNWEYKGVVMRQGRVPVAPHVVKYNGAFYMSGNSAPLYRAPAILGPYEIAGEWTDEKGQPLAGVSNGRPWKGSFDVDIFVDDDNKPFLYYPGRSTDGIYVAPLNPKDLSRFLAAPKRLFGFNTSHIWERYGDMNEYSEDCWIEGPWVIKRNGIYYLQYSASGTQWLTYATGVYTGKNPLGPFTYAPVNPILRKASGVVTGTAHGSVVQGPDGNWWQFYTTVMPNPPGGRRLGMDPISFDRNGNMVARGPTETPQWGPGAVSDPFRDGDSGSIQVSVNKVRQMNTRSKISSERPGREASYAVDNSNGTWWEPAETDAQPSLTLDLGPATEWDPPQQFTIDSSRILFTTGRGGGFGAGPAALPAPPAGATIAHQYKIETSSDGTTFNTILDKTGSRVTRYVEFDELPPTVCRYVRLTMTRWPQRPGAPFGIIEFTVFGKPVEHRSAAASGTRSGAQ